MTSQLHSDLVALDAAFATPQDWVKGGYRREVDGKECHCLVGKAMVIAQVPPSSMSIYEPRVRNMITALGFDSISDALAFNDNGNTAFKALKLRIDTAIRAHAPPKVKQPATIKKALK